MFFPDDYQQSRQKFLRNVEALSGPKQIERWAIPSLSDADLTVDLCYLPPLRSPRFLFVMISGTHGSESYAGAAIQSMFLSEVWPQVDRSEIGLALVHALNPYGFKRHVRWTENRVNLNRNCSAFDEIYQTANAKSVSLYDRFIPRQPVSDIQSQLIRALNNRGDQLHFDDIHFDEFTKATALGQFERPDGFEFGGFRAEPQIVKLTEFLKRVMPSYRDVVEIDLHTGLGERGHLHILTDGHEGALDPTLTAELFHRKEEAALYDFTPWDAEGFYKTLGSTNHLFQELKNPEQRLCALTFEYGTFGHSYEAQMSGLNLSALDYQAASHGYQSQDLEQEVKRLLLERSYPAEKAWGDKVLTTTREVLKRVMSRACGQIRS